MYVNQIKRTENIVLISNGGIGRNIMFTAVVRDLKKAFPDKKLIVIASFPNMFMYNPNVYKVYNMANPNYFYEDYLKEGKATVIDIEPYRHIDYLTKKKHFVECACDLLGIKCTSIIPDLHFVRNEFVLAQDFLTEKFKGKEKEGKPKPVVLIQYVGGKIPQGASVKDTMVSETTMYRRNLPLKSIQEVINQLIKKGYGVGCVQAQNQLLPKEATLIFYPLRAVIALLPYVKGVICVDSFLQHACTGLSKRAMVLWGGTSPKVLGYDTNVNLTQEKCNTPFCHRPNSYLWDVMPTGHLWDCPHNSECMNYSPEIILNNFKKVEEK